MGCQNLYVATDHASLVTVLGDQSLADVENPRLARIKERTLWWQFKIIHTPGKLQLAATWRFTCAFPALAFNSSVAFDFQHTHYNHNVSTIMHIFEKRQ